MKKIFSFFAAMLVAVAANATVWNIDNSSEGNLRRTLRDNVQIGDTVVLADGTYTEDQTMNVENKVVVMAAEGAHPVINQKGYFNMYTTAKFEGIKFNFVGEESNGYCFYFRSNSSDYIWIEGCEFQNFPKYICSSWEAYHIDSCIVNNCYFHDLGHGPFYFSASSLEGNINACDKLKVTNSTFANINVIDWVSVLDIRNNGNNVSAASAVLDVDHCTFYNCQGDYERMIQNYKSSLSTVTNCIMMNPVIEGKNPIYATYLYGGSIHHNLNYQTERQYGSGVTVTDSICRDPLFVDAANGDFTLGEGSPALGAGTDGSNLGDPRWNATEPAIPTVSMAGSMNNWTANVEGYVFTPAEDGLTATLSFTPNDYYYELKIVVGNEWLSLNGNDGLYTLHRDWTTVSNMQTEQGNLIFLPDVIDQEYKLIYTYETRALEIVYPIPVMSIAGSMNNWTANVEGYIFIPAEDEKTASLTFTPTENYYEFKVIRNDKWLSKLGDNDSKYWLTRSNPTVSALYETSQDQNLVLSADEINKPYTFTWTYANGTLDVTFPSQETAIHNAAVDATAVKMMENGQLVIIKNGVKYNALGAELR